MTRPASGSLGARVDQRARELVQDVSFGIMLEDCATRVLAAQPERPWASLATAKLEDADASLLRIARAISREGRLGQVVHAAIAAHLDGTLAAAGADELVAAIEDLEAWARPKQSTLEV
jgi:hypothetical protein